MDVPDDLRYTEDHEWLRVSDGEGTVGITAYAADELGDVVFVELPAVGRTVAAREPFGVIESVKAAADVYAPIDGEVIETNAAVVDSPELVNASPYGDAWLLRIKVKDPDQLAALLDAAAYDEHAAAAAH